jgi:hypothetical protein
MVRMNQRQARSRLEAGQRQALARHRFISSGLDSNLKMIDGHEKV